MSLKKHCSRCPPMSHIGWRWVAAVASTTSLPRTDRGGRSSVSLASLASERPIAAQFTAPFQVVFYAKLTIAQMRGLIEATDCIYEIFLAEPKIRDWLLHE